MAIDRVPKKHPLARETRPLDLATLSAYPLVTYVFSLTGESSFKRAFSELDLDPRVVFTARDADIIKTYVRMGMGVGVIASMAYECQDQEDLKAIEARGQAAAAVSYSQPPRTGSARSPINSSTRSWVSSAAAS